MTVMVNKVTARPSSCVRQSRLGRSRLRSLTPAAKGGGGGGGGGDNNKEVWFLDYGAGNVRSVRNAVSRLGYTIRDIEKPSDILSAPRLLFPGVGAFGNAMKRLRDLHYAEPLREYVSNGGSFLGICVGMQVLFDGSDEFGGCEGLGIIPGVIARFPSDEGLVVPHMGWNSVKEVEGGGGAKGGVVFNDCVAARERFYFVHSFRGEVTEGTREWVAAVAEYGGEFIAGVRKGAVHATQFHPEKSATAGLSILERFLSADREELEAVVERGEGGGAGGGKGKKRRRNKSEGLSKRLIACMDVRSDDSGELVVTKGDQYDVREEKTGEGGGGGGGGKVRDLGRPVPLAQKYFEEGADEVTFLNIMGFRAHPLGDMPMLEVMRKASERCFVPLTVGGGIRGFTDSDGKEYTALDVAAEYFRSGADKVSIGSDAVAAALSYMQTRACTGTTSIEQISTVYGAQAVVVSIDPRRVYVTSPSSTHNATIKTKRKGKGGEEYVWFQCTVKGGREGADIGAVEVAIASEALGAGEILLNCIDNDGQNAGFDTELVEMVSSAVSIPVIASSGAGHPSHFTDVFSNTSCSAALAAGIFHRNEVRIEEVKEEMEKNGIKTRR